MIAERRMSVSPDFQPLFEGAPHPYLVLVPDAVFTIVAVNDLYLAATGTRREAILGHSLFDICPDDPDDASAHETEDLRASLERVLSCRCQDAMDIRKRGTPRRNAPGQSEPRYWSPVNTPVLDAERRVRFIIHQMEDVTDFVVARDRLSQESTQRVERIKAHADRMDAELLRCTAEAKETKRQLKAATEELRRCEAELARARRDASRHEEEVVAALSRRIVDVQEEERRRLAGVVHDLICPNLAAVKINLGMIYGELPPEVVARLEARMADTSALLDDAAASLNALSTELRPVSLDYAGLGSALESYAHQFSRRTGIAVQVANEGSRVRLPAGLESLLFRIAQEALANCARHAQAGEVQIRLHHDVQHAVLSISDDGVGFDAAALEQYGHPAGSGILTMRARAEFAGGEFRLDSQPGQGTRIRVEV